jgi:hypothetical protein
LLSAENQIVLTYNTHFAALLPPCSLSASWHSAELRAQLYLKEFIIITVCSSNDMCFLKVRQKLAYLTGGAREVANNKWCETSESRTGRTDT